MNSEVLKVDMENPSLTTTSQPEVDQAKLRAEALEAIRLDSRDNPSAYLCETEAPFGGE